MKNKTVKLFWKYRVTKKRKAAAIKLTKLAYPKAKDWGAFVEIQLPSKPCFKFIWVFLIGHKAFSKIV